MVKYINSKNLDFVFMALANPTRRGVLLELMNGEKSAMELADPFDMSLPGISKHLKVLENAKLIRRKIKGRQHLFRVNPDSLHEASDWVKTFEIFWTEKLNNLEKYLAKENN